MFASQSSELRHTPTRHRAEEANTGPFVGVACRVARWPASPSALSRAYFYGTVCCQVLLDGWLRPSPDPYGPSETNLPCMSSHPVEAGAAWGKGSREDMRTGGACRSVIILAGSACSDRYLVPSVLVSAAFCTVLQMENSV